MLFQSYFPQACWIACLALFKRNLLALVCLRPDWTVIFFSHTSSHVWRTSLRHLPSWLIGFSCCGMYSNTTYQAGRHYDQRMGNVWPANRSHLLSPCLAGVEDNGRASICPPGGYCGPKTAHFRQQAFAVDFITLNRRAVLSLFPWDASRNPFVTRAWIYLCLNWDCYVT